MIEAKHTPGPWRIITTEMEPCHTETRIFTDWDHPQMKGPLPVVNRTIGVGTKESGPVHFISISPQDARLIAAAPELLEALQQLLDYREIADESGYVDGEGFVDIEAVREKAGAAIAKATQP